MKARKSLFALLLVVIFTAIVWTVLQNRPWTVPEQAKQLKNPLAGSDATLPSIRALYLDKCASCHGSSGKGDGHDATLYDPAPTNFTDAKHMSAMTDGELFYKLSEGHKPMPSFKKRLSEEQRWRMVLLIRAFEQGRADQPAATSGAPPATSGSRP